MLTDASQGLALAAKAAGNKEEALNNMKYIKVISALKEQNSVWKKKLQVCDSLMAEVQTGATVDLTPILPKPDPPPLARSFSRDAPLPLQDAEKVLLSKS